MKFLITIASILALNLGYSQGIQYPVAKAERGEMFNSIKYSSYTGHLFVEKSTSFGSIMEVFNTADSLVKTIKFPAAGRITLDHEGNFGAFYGSDNLVRFFDQLNLVMIDSVEIKDHDAVISVWFTSKNVGSGLGSSIIIGTSRSNYKYNISTKNLSEIKELKYFKIFDYHYETDQLLIGYWNESLSYDSKINTQFVTTSANPKSRKLLFMTKSYVMYSFFMNNGLDVICQDAGSLYSYSRNDFNMPIQDKSVHVLSKIDENTIAFWMPFRGACKKADCGDMFTIMYWEYPSGKILNTVDINTIPVTVNFVTNQTKNVAYFLNAGEENSIIALR